MDHTLIALEKEIEAWRVTAQVFRSLALFVGFPLVLLLGGDRLNMVQIQAADPSLKSVILIAGMALGAAGFGFLISSWASTSLNEMLTEALLADDGLTKDAARSILKRKPLSGHAVTVCYLAYFGGVSACLFLLAGGARLVEGVQWLTSGRWFLQ